jgi:type I restriction enzyme M protein
MTKDTFKQLLTFLNFEQQGNIFTKNFPEIDADLSVDFGKEVLIYPEAKGLVINERQTCNFSQAENFVVFECVHRLFERGYKPEHIELEPKWKLGHGASGGRADILVYNQEKKPLLLIECKTAGKEFEKAWKIMLNDGGQLFSYAQQIPQTDFLCLYASDFDEKTSNLSTSQRIISHKDNDKIIEQSDKKLKSFAEARDLKERFTVWRDTYQLEFTENGIFESNIQPYQIGKDKYTLDVDTRPIDSTDKKGKYHHFRTILRKYNIARKETAFEVLVNLFLCKIVDEKQHKDDLHFYWKGIAYDNYFDFVDRLQKLYQIGMKVFLEENITYISNQEIDEAFWTVKNKRNATKQRIQTLFKEQKFFTSNTFALRNVHNEDTFNKNVKVLLELVRMWQGLRLNTDEQNQFLGDMFEYFLDNSIKQSEGQFFTPMPVCKFIVMSLPLETVIQAKSEPLKAIDYACGSGHFLNEYALQITPLIAKYKKVDKSAYFKQTIGVEKEDRLAKIAKVAAFMYGQDDINIIDADALDIHAEIKPETFDVLVANPPFAVEGFLETLPEDQRGKYELFQTVNDLNNKNIQCFFIERAKQLLAPNGVAGIIVPSSVLSNSDSTHIASREILLKYFDIVAIAELGSNTFSKVGVNTVVLFIRRKALKPEPAEHYKNRVEDFFDGIKPGDEELEAYQDLNLIKTYCEQIDVSFTEYLKLLNVTVATIGELDALFETELFKDYKADFEKSTKIINLKRSTQFIKLSAKDKQKELNKRLIEYLQAIEKDKLYYFILAESNLCKVLIVKSPTDNKEQKQFLGYEWSGAKGQEGIKYNGGEIISDIITPLFNPKNATDTDKINWLIQQNFAGNEITTPNDYVSYANLIDLLDFSRNEFNKAFSLTPKKNLTIKTKWNLVRIENVLVKVDGAITKIPENQIKEVGKYPVITQEKDRLISGYSDGLPVTDLPLVVFGDHNCSLKYIDVPFLRGADGTQLLKVDKSQFIPKCFYYLLQLVNITNKEKYERHTKYLMSEKIPLPPLPTQIEIVQECENIDAEVTKAHEIITQAKGEIDTKVKNQFTKGFAEKKLSEITFINPSKTEIRNVDENTIVSFVEMASVSNNGFIAHKEDRPLKDLKKGSFTYFRENDIIIAKITPCMENGKCALATNLTNGLAMGSSEFHVFRSKAEISSNYVFYFLNREYIRKEAEKNMTGSSGHRRVPANFYENLKIPVPTIAVQEQLVAEITKLESKISNAQEIIKDAPNRKQAVMKEYL